VPATLVAMRLFPAILGLGLIFGVATLEASFIPLSHLQASTVALFQDYTTKFEQLVSVPFTVSGKLWIDDDHSSKRKDYDAGKPIVEARENQDIRNGSIHHYSGSIRVPGATIDQVRRVMQSYSSYPTYFKPDVERGSGSVQPCLASPGACLHGRHRQPRRLRRRRPDGRAGAAGVSAGERRSPPASRSCPSPARCAVRVAG